MPRPWLIATAFIICLIVAFGAMAWVSVRIVRLDEAEARLLRQVALEEDVRLALGRMDAMMAPLIAQENARPYFAYRAFYPPQRAYTEMFAAIEFSKILVPSPLLTFNSDQIQLHFQIGPDGELTSPQVPQSNMRDVAESQFTTHERIAAAEERLKRLRPALSRDTLLALLPIAPMESADRHLTLMQVFPQQQLAEGSQNGATNDEPQQVERNADPKSRLGNRSQIEWQARAKDLQTYSANVAEQKAQQAKTGPLSDVTEGVMKPLWLGEALVLVRRVRVNGDDYIQGVWLNWANVREQLTGAVADIFPQARLKRVESADYEATARMLASIPVKLMIDDDAMITAAATGAETASSTTAVILIVAWACMLLAAVAVGVLLMGALALSERRGAFVSAVTHELRTPLTTFRMYTEMLQRGMVTDPQRQGEYLGTMRGEAERLSHLVENVLAYARLERGNPASRMQQVPLGELIEGVRPRLKQRAEQAGMQLTVEPNGVSDTKVHADPGAVEQVLFNLVDNACKYAGGADDRHIHVEASRQNGFVEVRVRDHGPGVSPDESRRLFQPFRKSARDAAHSAPGVGLGLALSRRLARAMGGDLHIRECKESGACFEMTLPVAKPST